MRKFWIGGIAVFSAACVIFVAAGSRFSRRVPSIGAIASVVQQKIQGAVRVFRQVPAMPDQVVSSDGTVVIRSGDIEAGRDVWQAIEGGDAGSVFGLCASAAPDWTADWLHREALFILNEWSHTDFGVSFDSASARQQADLKSRLQATMRKNTYDGLWNTITVDPVRGRAIAANTVYYCNLFTHGPPDAAALKHTISDPVKLRRLAAFFFWTSWTASTHRPADNITYTSNWPHEDLVGNAPSRDAIAWSGVGIVVLLAGIGAMARKHAQTKKEAQKGVTPGREPAAGPARLSLRKPLPWIFPVSSAVFVLIAAAALVFGKQTNIDVAWFGWRRAIDVWSEGFIGFLAAVVVSLAFARSNLISTRSASRAVTQTAAAYCVSAIIGTLASLAGDGIPTFVIALRSAFNALAVMPLVPVCGEAWHAVKALPPEDRNGLGRWAVTFFFAAAFWTLVASGLIGFLTGPPVALYYMQGLDIASVHDRIVLPGVCGMLEIGLLLLMLQERTPSVAGRGRFLRWIFRSLNIGVCAWLVVSLLPAGLMQLWASVETGYWYARSPEFLQSNVMAVLRSFVP